MVTQLEAWFGELGLPILALGGYSSQTFTRQVLVDARRQRRPAVLLYGGDFYPSGEDIDRDFIARKGCFSDVVRVALTSDQVAEHRLPPQPGKATDSRADGFVARHGRLVQIELDALPPRGPAPALPERNRRLHGHYVHLPRRVGARGPRARSAERPGGRLMVAANPRVDRCV